MTPDSPHNPPQDVPGTAGAALPAPPVLRMGAVLTATVVVGFAVAAGVLLVADKPHWIGLAGLAGAAALVGSLLSVEILRRGAKRNQEAVLLAALAGMGVRLLVTGAAAVGMVAGLGMERKPVLLALGAAYVLLLIAEARLLSGYFKTFPGFGRPAAGATVSPPSPTHPAEPSAC